MVVVGGGGGGGGGGWWVVLVVVVGGGGGGGLTCYSLHHNIQERRGQPITHIILCSVT